MILFDEYTEKEGKADFLKRKSDTTTEIFPAKLLANPPIMLTLRGADPNKRLCAPSEPSERMNKRLFTSAEPSEVMNKHLFAFAGSLETMNKRLFTSAESSEVMNKRLFASAKGLDAEICAYSPPPSPRRAQIRLYSGHAS